MFEYLSLLKYLLLCSILFGRGQKRFCSGFLDLQDLTLLVHFQYSSTRMFWKRRCSVGISTNIFPVLTHSRIYFIKTKYGIRIVAGRTRFGRKTLLTYLPRSVTRQVNLE